MVFRVKIQLRSIHPRKRQSRSTNRWRKHIGRQIEPAHIDFPRNKSIRQQLCESTRRKNLPHVFSMRACQVSPLLWRNFRFRFQPSCSRYRNMHPLGAYRALLIGLHTKTFEVLTWWKKVTVVTNNRRAILACHGPVWCYKETDHKLTFFRKERLEAVYRIYPMRELRSRSWSRK